MVGDTVLFTTIRTLLQQCNHVFYARVRKEKIAKLNRMLFRYFNQPIVQEGYDIPKWHHALAKQLSDGTGLDIYPGMTDSKGWLSANIEIVFGLFVVILSDEFADLLTMD